MGTSRVLLLVIAALWTAFCLFVPSPVFARQQPKTLDPVKATEIELNKLGMGALKQAYSELKDKEEPPGPDKYNPGMNMAGGGGGGGGGQGGGGGGVNYRRRTKESNLKYEKRMEVKSAGPQKWAWHNDTQPGDNTGERPELWHNSTEVDTDSPQPNDKFKTMLARTLAKENMPSSAFGGGGQAASSPAGGQQGGQSCGCGDDEGKKGFTGNDECGNQMAGSDATAEDARQQLTADPNGQRPQTKGNAQGDQASRGGSAGEDAQQNTTAAFDCFVEYLINVANENAGAPCSSSQPSKTYANVVWMVQQMWKACYLPMGILFLLPGAVITNTKSLVSFGILSVRDEDTPSPFTGIFRSVIAIFLIPATQLIVSYVIDVGNSCEYEVTKFVQLPLIYLWADEQVQTFSPDQQGKLIKNLPIVPSAPYRGKWASMPTKGAVLEQISGLDSALSEIANEALHMITIGLTIATAFQLVLMCYLFLLGPLAAAFFAWPSGVGRDLFRKAFATWVDGVVILALWRFWWNVVLLCMTVRLQSGNVNPFDYFEVYYLVAFMCIMLVVPFNPFDFKAGELVGQVMMKAEGVAAKVAQAGKGGGSGGGGKGGGGGGAQAGGGGGCAPSG